ncbi:hypothetical protein ABID08_006329 [Rhizobium binae]|uniref:Transposase IS116/IS110/IS902 C-terminal domain-containing protein n=1 Tax=Rhizobium binae TaxID=1138190 RepID=A0ABV2MR53_9HYPH
MRDLVRARLAAVRSLRQARQQLSGFLLRHGFHYGRPAWTQMHRRWLPGLRFEQPIHNIVLEDHIATIDAATERRDRLTKQIETMLGDWSLAPVVVALQSLPGMALVTAATIIAELGDLSRFTNPRQLMAYLGLVPSERSRCGADSDLKPAAIPIKNRPVVGTEDIPWVSNFGINHLAMNEDILMPAKRRLTMRQLRQMLRLAGSGRSSREIAVVLGMALVSGYESNAYRPLMLSVIPASAECDSFGIPESVKIEQTGDLQWVRRLHCAMILMVLLCGSSRKGPGMPLKRGGFWRWRKFMTVARVQMRPGSGA